MQFFTGTSRNTQWKSYMLSLTLCVCGISKIMHCGILITMPYWSVKISAWINLCIIAVSIAVFSILLFFIHSHSFNQITSIVYDLDGDLLFADKYSNCVRRYYLTTNTHDEFAGRCGSYGNRDGKQKKRSASRWQNKTATINNCWHIHLTMM